MKNILVTGCAGFIGSHVCERLLDLGYHVMGIDNFDPLYSIERKYHNLEEFRNQPFFQFVEVDITDKEALQRVFPDKVDMVIHLAARAGIQSSVNDPVGYLHANAIGTQNLLEAMRLHEAKKLIFGSSSSVYGVNNTVPFFEDMPLHAPASPYAASKIACELLNFTSHHLYQTDVVNLRLFTVYGPRQRPDLAIYKFTEQIYKGEEMTLYGDGSSARDYTYIDDVVDGIMGAMKYLFENNGVYESVNLGNQKPILLREVIEAIATASNRKPQIANLPVQPGDMELTCANIAKANALLGYCPKHDFKEGIKLFVAWYIENCLAEAV